MRGQAADAGVRDVTGKTVESGMLRGNCITSWRSGSTITGLCGHHTAHVSSESSERLQTGRQENGTGDMVQGEYVVEMEYRGIGTGARPRCMLTDLSTTPSSVSRYTMRMWKVDVLVVADNVGLKEVVQVLAIL